jgi:hypothetical protein
MTDLQKRLLRRMKMSVEKFRSGTLSYANLVGDLEGSLDAGEFTDRAFVDAWYDHWMPLEICNAKNKNGDVVTLSECIACVSQFERFLDEYLKGMSGENDN